MEAYSKFVAEVLGTAILMFCGCMGCLTWKTTDEPSPYIGGISFGLTVMILIQVYGHISGAHFNPAVTLAAVVYRLISIPVCIHPISIFFIIQKNHASFQRSQKSRINFNGQKSRWFFLAQFNLILPYFDLF